MSKYRRPHFDNHDASEKEGKASVVYKQTVFLCEMASFSREINSFCRLCLSGNDANLLPTSKIIDATLTIDDIERFTGIRIEDENMSCVICEDCHNKLLKFTAFRACCMTNDVRFRKMVRTIREHGCEAVIRIKEKMVHSTIVRTEANNEQYKNVVDDNFTITYVESTFDDHAEEVVGEKSVENSDIDEEVVEIIVQTDLQSNRTELDISVSPASVADQQHDEPTVIDSFTNDKRRKIAERSVPNTTSRITGKSREAKLNKKYPRKQQLSRPTIQKQLCPVCGKLVQYLPDHIVSHTKEQKYACDHCSMTCSRKSYLKLHVEAVHLKKVVKSCELCSRDFTHISGYAAHMRAQHNVGEWYVCKICNLKFRHPGGLRGHNNRKHNAESNCECPICGMKFEDKKGLKDHSRVHSNEKPFACTFCPKRFKSPNAHRTHMLVHKGVVFACTLCHKSYRYKSLLNAHMKKVHTKENLRNDQYLERKCTNMIKEATPNAVGKQILILRAMTNNICEINTICRLCLCDDNEVLFPMSCLSDSSITEEDIERFTGLELFREENVCYTICIDCANKLKKCVLFRSVCLSNDAQFKLMFAVCIGSNGKECFSTENDSVTVESAVEHNESSVEFEIVDIKNVHKIEQLSIVENGKESKVKLTSEDPPVGERNASGDDGFEVKSEQHSYILTNSAVINTVEDDDDDTKGISQITEEEADDVEVKDSSHKRLKSTTPSISNITKSKTGRAYTRCDICGKTVLYIKTHLRSHANDEKFACPYCPHKTRYQKHLNTHIKTDHRKEVSKSCEICGIDFFSQITYTKHMTSKHGAGEYECETCSKKFSQRKLFNIHLRRAHRKDRPKRPKKLCVICGARVTYISRHIQSHTQEKKYPCPHCSIEMVDSGNLARHVQSVHLKKSVKSCEICNIGFKYDVSYKSHMLREHGIGNTFDCKQCPRKFNHRSGLESHVARAHSNLRKFACKICGMEFKIGSHLQRHQMVHSTEQPYACSQCPKRFKSKNSRRTHQLTHTGIVFSCKHCDKSYRYKSVLDTHIRQKHPETMTVDT
ncbi:zinc finger protein 729-like [Anopheles moucheti]|uniref:zinc finger protein 729-like n=1 Tax=Anopheles moucheti TaxID=186751 RepID=UPI0022F0F336|nr:zinc finger protein 729-like [Anopheles moucheti]